MKPIRTKSTTTGYPEDFKEVFKHYQLKKAVIEKYNKEEVTTLKPRNNEQKYI